MTRYLVSIAIGPVQDFISAARTRDLWFGRRLLSELSKAAARYLRMHGELIFPYSDNLERNLTAGSEYAVVNKLLVFVDAEDEKELREIVRATRSQVRDCLMREALEAVDKASELAFQEMGIRPLWRSQLEHDSALEFHAAWRPASPDYKSDLEQVEALAVGRKALRDFPAYPGIAGLPKSSLDGVRESVIEKNGLLDEQYFVRPGEELDALGLVKRFGGESPRFESATDVAAVPYIKRLQSPKYRAGLRRYRAYLEANKRRIPNSDSYLYPHYSRTGKNIDPGLRELVRSLEFPLPEPPYYGFFIGDGDNMGAAISRLNDKGEYQAFSSALSGFASSVARLFQDRNKGHLIFVGGDDVMALLPLDTAIETAFEIRLAFQAAMASYEVTFSGGLAVTHALDPLTEARRLAQDAEKKAKGVPGKNALAIIVSPRSGADVMMRGRWTQLREPLGQAVQHYVDRSISQGFAYELRTLLDTTDRLGMQHLDEALFPMARAIAEKKEAKLSFLNRLDDFEKLPEANRVKLERLTKLLLVARPFARSKREAAAQ